MKLRSSAIAGIVLVSVACTPDPEGGVPGNAGAATVAPTPTTEDQSAAPDNLSERLLSLGYTLGAPIEPGTDDKVGTTLYVRGKAYDGYNLYTLYGQAKAFMADMEGDLVHEWGSEEDQPQSPLERTLEFVKGWQYSVLEPGGNLLTLVSRGSLLKVDWQSNVIWNNKELATHHDISVSPEGKYYSLTEAFRVVGPSNHLILDSVLCIVNTDGIIERSLSIYDVLVKNPAIRSHIERDLSIRYAPYADTDLDALIAEMDAERQSFWKPAYRAAARELLSTGSSDRYNFRELFTLARSLPKSPTDIFHVNTLAPTPAHPAGLWEAGDMLVSIRNYDLVGVISLRREELVWAWGPGELKMQHQPSILDNHNVLIFDNGREASRVVEVDPTTNKIAWQYDGAGEPFYTPSEGGAQRLRNGNTLITISRSGRVIEVMPSGEVVWEYWTALREAEGRAERQVVYRMTRIESDVADSHLLRE